MVSMDGINTCASYWSAHQLKPRDAYIMINLFYMDHLCIVDSTSTKVVGSVPLPDAGVIRFGGSHPQCRYSSVHKAFKVVYLCLPPKHHGSPISSGTI